RMASRGGAVRQFEIGGGQRCDLVAWRRRGGDASVERGEFRGGAVGPGGAGSSAATSSRAGVVTTTHPSNVAIPAKVPSDRAVRRRASSASKDAFIVSRPGPCAWYPRAPRAGSPPAI